MKARAFAWNPTHSIVPIGATQIGNISVENIDQAGFQVNAGGLDWYNGPNEDLGYVICHVSGPRTAAAGSEIISGTTIGFWRTNGLNLYSFVDLGNYIANDSGSPQFFEDGADVKNWLLSNGMWTNYELIVGDSSDITLYLDASDQLSYPGTGTTWFDILNSSDDITLIGSPTFTSATPSYFTFNGTTQRGSGSGAGVVPQTAYTKSCWFYLNSYADNNLVSSSTGGHFMYFASTSTLYSGHANWGNYSAYPSNQTFDLNTWYCVTLTFNTTDGMTLYVNGYQDSTYTANKAAHAGDGSTNIASFDTGNLLNGRIAKVYCYNRSLTAAEVLQNFMADRVFFSI